MVLPVAIPVLSAVVTVVAADLAEVAQAADSRVVALDYFPDCSTTMVAAVSAAVAVAA